MKSPIGTGVRELAGPNALTACFGITLLVLLNESKPSGEIRLDKSRAGVDVDLAQRRVAGVNESMRCVRGNDDDAAGVHFERFIAERHAGAAFERERDLGPWPVFAVTM